MTEINTLSRKDLSTVSNGLSIVAKEFDHHVEEFREIAKALRSGEQVALFAPGENGAKAADRLAEQFTQQRDDSRRLAELFTNAHRGELVIEPYDGDES